MVNHPGEWTPGTVTNLRQLANKRIGLYRPYHGPRSTLYDPFMLTFGEALDRPVSEVGAETHRLAEHFVPGMLVPAGFEEAYYRNFNLPEQLRLIFKGINPYRVDEDELEGLCEQAQSLVRSSVLVDDAVQVFYRALGNAGLNAGEVHARRPGELYAETAQRVTPPGTAVLHAMKRLWAHDWSFDNVLRRIDDTGGFGLDARPTLLLAGTAGVQDERQAQALGVATALVNSTGLVGLP